MSEKTEYIKNKIKKYYQERKYKIIMKNRLKKE